MHGGSLIGARDPRGSIRHTLLKIRKLCTRTSSRSTVRLGYMQGVYERFLTGRRQLHRPDWAGEGPSRYTYSMDAVTNLPDKLS